MDLIRKRPSYFGLPNNLKNDDLNELPIVLYHSKSDKLKKLNLKFKDIINIMTISKNEGKIFSLKLK